MSMQERDVLLAELEFHKIEYTALQQEALKWQEIERQYLNLSITAVGVGILFSQIFTSPNLQTTILILPLIFHVFFREMIDCAKRTVQISGYLAEHLIPRINNILNLLGRDRSAIVVLGREYYNPLGNTELTIFIIQPMRYWIPVSGIVGLIVIYILNLFYLNLPIHPVNIILITVNIVFMFLTMIEGIVFYHKYAKQTKKLKKQLQRQNLID